MIEIKTNIKLETALKCEKLGWSIIPVKEDKTPYISSWVKYQQESASEEQIKEWWAKWPDANPAVVTGKISNLVVLDIDAKGENPRSVDEFPLGNTVHSRTGNAGWHFFFLHPGYHVKSTNGKLFGQGVDIKADGGYILLPSSTIGLAKDYWWAVEPDDSEPIPPLPEWFEEKIKEDQKEVSSSKPSPYLNLLVGSRNNNITSMTGKLLATLKQDDWETFVRPLMHLVNKGAEKPLPNSEIDTIYRSIVKAELSKRITSETKKELLVMGAKELSNAEFPEAAWAVQGLFETETVNMVSAAPNNFKSWLTLYIAICLSKGKPLFGNLAVKQQGVLIINEEDRARQIRERLNILEKEWDNLPIHFMVSNEIQLDEKTVDSIIGIGKDRGVKFIIFDSLRSIHSAEENDSTAMQGVMNNLKKITNAGFTILFTHHNRKKSGFGKSNMGAEETRGSSAINAAVHGHISLEPQKDKDTDTQYLIISQDKLKGDKKMNPIKVIINIDGKDDFFTYDGEYNGAKSNKKVYEEILTTMTNLRKWVTVDDLVESEIAGNKSIRESLKLLGLDGKIVMLEGKDIRLQGLDVLDDSKPIHHNTKYYNVVPAENS
ncbi:MAG: bifunctional DNA primase/polymerase [Patescibacteria group bacterium]